MNRILRSIPIFLVLAAIGWPKEAHAQTVNKKIRGVDISLGSLDMNLPGTHPNATNTAGIVLKRLTTAQRDAITCDGTHEGQLVYNSTTDAVNVCTSGAWAAIVAGGGGESLDATYLIGASISITNVQGTVDLDDDQTGAGSALRVDGDGIVAGAADHSYIIVDSNTAHTTTGAVRAALFDMSGATVAGGTPEGVRIAMGAAANNALNITTGSVAIGASGTLTQTGVGGSTVYTITAGDVVWSDSSLAITDADNAASVSATNNTATTVGAAAATGVVDLASTSLTTGALVNLELTEATLAGGWYLRGWDVTAGAAVFSFAENGALTIAGSAAGTDAATLTAGDLTLASGHIAQALGNHTLTDGNLTLSEGTASITNTTVGEAALNITANGVRTVNIIDFSTNSSGNTEPMIDVNLSGAFGANSPWLDVDVSAAAAGNVVDLTAGAVLYTGDLVSLNTGATSTGGQALVITGGAAGRTTNLVSIDDNTTGSGIGLAIDYAGTNAAQTIILTDATTAEGLWVSFTGAATGNAVRIDMANADVGAGGLNLDDSGNRNWSDELLQVTSGTGTGVADVALVMYEGDGVTDALEVHLNPDAAATGRGLFIDATDAQFEGDALGVDLTTAAAVAQGVVIDCGARAASADCNTIADAGTDAGDSAFISKTGAASTGSNVRLENTVVVASAANTGRALTVDYNAAAADSASRVALFRAHTSAWADAAANDREVVLIEASMAGSAGAGDDYALRLNASGADVEALHVDAGISQFDEPIRVGIDATGAGTSTFEMAAAGHIVIDADSVVATAAGGEIDLGVTTATANVAGIDVVNTTTADVGTYGIGSTISTSANTTTLNGAFFADITGNNNALQTGFLIGYQANTPTNVDAATNLVGFNCDPGYTGSDDSCLGSIDVQLVIREHNTAAGAGGATGNGASVTITAGAAGAVAADDGDVVLQIADTGAGGAGDSGRLIVEVDGGQDELDIDPDRTGVDPTDKTTFAGVLYADVARGWGTLRFSLGDCITAAGAACTIAASATARPYLNVSYADAGLDSVWSAIIPDDFDAGSPLYVTLDYVLDSATVGGAPADVVEFDLGGDSIAATEAWTGAALPAAGTACDVDVETPGTYADEDLVRCRATFTPAGTVPGEMLTLRAVRDAADTYTGAVKLVGLTATYRTDR